MDNDQVARAIGSYVDTGNLAGAATVIWRAGRAYATCVGWRDIGARLPVRRDTIFRIASVSKPITSVAALMLMEEGRFALSDPIAHWAPEFAGMRVLASPEAPLNETHDARRPITFEDLLTHRSGLTYGDFHSGPIGAAYADVLGGHIDNELTPDQWIERLAMLPLIDQPGAAFHYGHSTDLLGFLIARIEGSRLEDVLQRRIFGPLGMKDTGFTVAKENHRRRASLYGFDDSGQLVELPRVPGNHTMLQRPDSMRYVSGGQGLWTTLDDFLAFARLFVEEGAVNGVRLLEPATLATMTTNHLTTSQRENAEMFGLPMFDRGHGFGLGVAVVMEPDLADSTLCGGGTGSVGWPGAYGSWWQADPNDGSVSIFLTHRMVDMDQLANGIGLGALMAVRDFQAVGAKVLGTASQA